MHPDAGPSRAPSYPLKPLPPGGRGLKASPPRAGPSRWDEFERERDRDGYRGEGSAPRPYPIPPWSNRPPRQTSRYPPGPGPTSRPRSLSPSPPRRPFDRPSSTWEREREPPRGGSGRDWERERDLDRAYDYDHDYDAGWQGGDRSLRRPSSFSSLPPRLPPSDRRDRDERASWGERERWDERDRDRGLRGRTPPHLVNSRYPPNRARSPPPPLARGPQRTISTASSPYPGAGRIPPGRPAPALRDAERGFQPRRVSGGASSPRAGQATNVLPSPTYSKSSEPILSGHARSQRGSSSPIDRKRSRDFDRPLSLPPSAPAVSAFAPLAVKTESLPSPAPLQSQSQAGDDSRVEEGGQGEEDLEEGEVVSPVHAPRAAPVWDEPSRRWSPPRERDRALPLWEREREWARDRERERDLPWERERERERGMDRRRGSPLPGLGLEGWRRSPEPRDPREREPRGTRPRQSLSNPPRERVTSLEDPAVGAKEKLGNEPATTTSVEAVSDRVVDKDKDREPEEGELPSTSPVVPTHDLKVDEPATPPVPPPAAIESVMEQEPQPEPEMAAPPIEPQQNAEPQSGHTQPSVQTETLETSQTPATPSFPPPTTTPAPPAPLSGAISLPAPRPTTPPVSTSTTGQSEDVIMESQVIETQVEMTPAEKAVVTGGEEGEDVVMAEAETEVKEEASKDALPAVAPAAQVVEASQSELSLSTEIVVQKEVVVEKRVPMDVDVREDTPKTPTHPPPAATAPEPTSTSTNRSTIAERRSILLPPTTAPFDRTPHKDPMPTTSTDHTEDAGPPTGPIGSTPGPGREEEENGDEDEGDDEDRKEEMRQMRLVAGVKRAQAKDIVFHDFPILAWNLAAAPEETSRIAAQTDAEREQYLRKITNPMRKQQTHAAKFVGILVAREKKMEERKVQELREDYLGLNEQWKEHIAYLDGLMKERGEPPADFQTLLGPTVVTNAFPNGAQPTTPGVDEFFTSHSSRSNRRRGLGDIVSTDAELEEIMAAIAQQEQSDPLLRAAKTAAVIPDMILSEERGLKYDDDNDLVQDPVSFYDFEGIEEPIWTSEERAIFVKRYLAYPKQFGRISDGIPNKSSGDCVLYYYRTKKEVDYKAILAHKRGGGKRKLALKKGVKSSALMADLTRAKPTIPGKDDGAAATPVRGREPSVSFAPTTGRRGRGGHVGEGGRKKKRGPPVSVPVTPSEEHDEETYGESASTSRAGSETPATSGKSKMRMTVKTAKRPRVSSIPELASTPLQPSPSSSMPNSAVTEIVTPIGGGGTLAGAGDIGTEMAANALASLADAASSAAQAELLPPVKRPGKRRKVTAPEGEQPTPNHDPADPSAPAVNGAATQPPADKPARRSATNSYWSVEEKRKVKELVTVHGMEAKLIAAQLKGKSERQVVNYMEGHRAELEPLEGSAVESEVKGQVIESPREPSSSAGRTIYDAFPAFASADRYEPRLGTFPSSKPPTTAIPSLPPPQLRAPSPVQDSSPARPIQRTGGGMRISALLNDDVPAETKPVPETPAETGSDGTVEESPKGAPPVPAVPSYRYEPPQHLDERYSTGRPSHSPSLPPLGYPSAGWNGHQEHHRPQTAMPAPTLAHRPSWDSQSHPGQIPRASSFGGQPSHHPPYDNHNLPPIRSQTPLGPSFMNNHLDRQVSRDREEPPAPLPAGVGGRDGERRYDEKKDRFGAAALPSMRYNGELHGSERRGEEGQESRRHSDGA